MQLNGIVIFLTCIILAQGISAHVTWLVVSLDVGNSTWLPLFSGTLLSPLTQIRPFFVFVDWLGFCYFQNAGPTCIWY